MAFLDGMVDFFEGSVAFLKAVGVCFEEMEVCPDKDIPAGVP